MDKSFCDASPKTTKWSMCFICVLFHSFVRNKEGTVVDFRKNNLEQYPEAEKMYIEGFKFDFVPRFIFSFFHNLYALSFCCSAFDTIDTNFLPTNADKLLELKMSQNSLRRIAGNVFKSAKYLRILELNQNQIKDLDKDAFDGLGSLKLLNLTGNRVKFIHELQFKDLHELKHLILDDNSFENFEVNTFKTLGKLQIFSAQNNSVLYIDREILSGLTSLQELKLNGNRITKLETGTFSDMPELRILELNDNQIKTIHGNAFKGCFKALYKISLQNNVIKRLAGTTISQLLNLKELNVINNICVDKKFNNVQDAINQLQLTCDPKPNDCLVPNIMNGWISMVESLQNVTIGSYYDDFELVEVKCEAGYSLLIEKTLDNLVACVADGNSSSWNKDFLQCQSRMLLVYFS